MPTPNISKKVAAEGPADLKTGLTPADKEAMEQARLLAEAEKAIEAAALPPEIADDPEMVLQEIRIDVFNLSRRWVKLTPSMCKVKNCGWDAAVKMNCAGWDAAPLNQVMPSGKTYGQSLIEMREYHQATAHILDQSNDHIIKESEMNKRQWAVGGARTDFLQAAR